MTENETEISFFNRELYEAFKKDPEVSPPHSHVLTSLRLTDVLIQTKWE